MVRDPKRDTMMSVHTEEAKLLLAYAEIYADLEMWDECFELLGQALRISRGLKG
jgi:hypothetical protein